MSTNGRQLFQIWSVMHSICELHGSCSSQRLAPKTDSSVWCLVNPIPALWARCLISWLKQNKAPQFV